MKDILVSIVIPVYYNEENLIPLYEDIKDKIYSHTENSKNYTKHQS